MTNYLLPWLGLTAQLPYETGSVSGNFESFCLAVGSPMLTTFSLMSTTLNAHSTSKVFEAEFGNGKANGDIKEAVDAAEYFLCGSQQAPVRIKEEQFREMFDEVPGTLRDRWVIVKERLRNTRRQYTFSLVAQTSFGVVAWVLTIVGSYVTSLGQHSEALLLSSGTLWTWLVPVVLGWMAVGVQSRENTVRDAIQGERREREATPLKALEVEENNPSQELTALLGYVKGDERWQGPAYNYARILTYPKLRDRIVAAFKERLERQERSVGSAESEHNVQNQQVEPVVHEQDPTHNPTNSSTEPSHNIQTLQVEPPSHDQTSTSSSAITIAPSTDHPPPPHTNTNELEKAHTSTSNTNNPYTPWQKILDTPDWAKNFLVSNLVAVTLQWGTTGSAIVISYLTEVRGLGCRSGSYLLYGILATAAHVLLLTSVALSHHAMLKVTMGEQSQNKTTTKKPTKSSSPTAIQYLAVLTRFLGKSLATFNALWIILSSIFELIGFYESCWCTGTVLGLGNRAWVVLFVSGDKMREDAEPSWIGGLAMSLLTMVGTYFVSKLYSWGRRT